MIFKIYYQESKKEMPRRENTRSLYIEADSQPEAIKRVEDHNPDFNLEQIEVLEGKTLEYEQQGVNYKLVEY
ncbi:DNA-directed RNA polymerase subunit epsilon [Pediococcus acidilactici]|uniref:DNA-directed RNA polymerase subunit epsilon n=1 Tax=Pediococcus acidilactici TaxID=1254 RepID=UPI003A92444B